MKRKGFTLVELLVVIAIIGILAGFIFPTLRSARIQAKRGATSATISMLELAINNYLNDFGRYPDYPVYPTSKNAPNNDNLPNPDNPNAEPPGLTVPGMPERANDLIMRILTGRYYDGSQWRDDMNVRVSNRWNGPYIELKEGRDYSDNTDLGSNRMAYIDNWRVTKTPAWPNGARVRMNTYFHFQFPKTPENIPQIESMVTFNGDSFDIWSYGPDGAGQYYTSIYRKTGPMAGTDTRDTERNNYKIWDDKNFGPTGSYKRLVNKDNIINW